MSSTKLSERGHVRCLNKRIECRGCICYAQAEFNINRVWQNKIKATEMIGSSFIVG